jgi:hypothetical protein
MRHYVSTFAGETLGFFFSFTLCALGIAITADADEKLADDATVIEVMLHSLHFLVSFVSLAGDENDVAIPCIFERGFDGFTTIHDAGVTLRTSESFHGIGDDGLGDFTAWIITGDNADVAARLSRSGHLRTLRAVSITTTAKHGDDSARAK